MFETLCDLIPEFESLFPSSLLNEAIKVKNGLGEVSRDIFMEIGNLVFLTLDAGLDSWVNGGIHPMLCEATGYIVMVFWSKHNLEKFLREYPLVVGDGEGTSSVFYSQVELVMKQFERNLEAKS
ncbi:putative exocyst complex component Exo70, cullin repeat-like-containing domain-containing protein [Medicago truncatula]|uniref:Exocyst subunit Exo70 family protein n=1 Tax=Medicago truncatula TaxID=3880 RepID=A0A396HVV9_MEDTR|nr:putative exocyst complex component Exo70, cullin repeat-like-containing domain-containing protein [Medicago truncatula]